MILIMQTMRIYKMCTCRSERCSFFVHHLSKSLFASGNMLCDSRSAVISGVQEQAAYEIIH